jgi:hypothetical protein
MQEHSFDMNAERSKADAAPPVAISQAPPASRAALAARRLPRVKAITSNVSFRGPTWKPALRVPSTSC